MVNKLNLNQIRIILAFLCLTFAIFFSGYSFGLAQVEQMVNYQQKIYSPGIDLSGGTVYGYSDMALKFSLMSFCYCLFLLITRKTRRITMEIAGLICILFAVLETSLFIFVTGGGYLPG